jgi:hypothetical protein
MDTRFLETAERIAVETISSRGPAARAELMAAWQAAGVDTSSQRGYHLIWHLAHTGVVCFGPVRNGQQLLTLVSGQAPAVGRTGRGDALETLACRYFVSHGPATPADLARWANLTAADTRLAVAAARPRLAALTIDDVEYLLGPDTQDELASCREEARGVIALPHFDEMLFGYRDRSPTVPDDLSAQVFVHRNGVPRCTIIVNGQVAATWRRPVKHPGEPTEITPLIPLTEQITRSAASKASALR